MITEFIKYNENNSYDYDIIRVYIDNSTFFGNIQIFCFENDIEWSFRGKLRIDYPEIISEFYIDINIQKKEMNICTMEYVNIANEVYKEKNYTLDPHIYKEFEYYDIRSIIIKGTKTPYYKPRVINRLLEKKSYKYSEIVVKVNDIEELKILEQELNDIHFKLYRLLSTHCENKEFPNYIFIPTDHNLGDYIIISFLSSQPTDAKLKYYIYDNEHVDSHIYNISELNQVKNILLNGELIKTPVYKPKKFNRTLESISEMFHNKYKYDVISLHPKSVEESYKFQKLLFKYGIKWNNNSDDLLNLPFNYLCVFLVPYSGDIPRIYVSDNIDNLDNNYKELKVDKKVYNIDDYDEVEMILKFGQKVPIYSPKKVNRTLDSITEGFINKYKYDVIVLSPETTEEGYKFQKLLFKYGIYWQGSTKEKLMDVFNYSKLLGLVVFLVPQEEKQPSVYYGSYDDIKRWYPNFKLDDKIYNIKDYDEVEKILKYGNKVPLYQPKKIDRSI